MPKIHSTWECIFCRKVFPSEDEANKCEAAHSRPLQIVDAGYPSYDNTTFPYSVTVKLSDGSEVTYYHQGYV